MTKYCDLIHPQNSHVSWKGLFQNENSYPTIIFLETCWFSSECSFFKVCFFRINLESPWKQPRNECLIRQYEGRTCLMILFPNLLVGSALGPYYCNIHHPCWNSRLCSWRQAYIHSKYKGFDSKCPWTYYKYLSIAIGWCTRQHTPTNHILDSPQKIATNTSKHTFDASQPHGT